MRKVSVCLSVYPPVKRVHCDKTAARYVQVFIQYERSFSLVFWEEEWLVGATPSIWNFGSIGRHWSEIADFEPIFALSASAVKPSEKSAINISRKSTTCFTMNLRWSSYVALKPLKGGAQKMQNGIFPHKIAIHLKKVCYKVSLCENCQRRSCKAFIGLTNRAKMIVPSGVHG